jgi:NitT/TauT family transport system ATP-binding protein
VNPAEPLLTLHNLRLRYDSGTVALDGVDLTIQPGEFLSIVGPSGCGKSTLLRIIAGLLSGVDGTLRWSRPPQAGGIGFVFQEPTLMPWASVAANVRLPLDLAGTPRLIAEQKISLRLDQVGLSDFATAYPRELSGGMRMRVALARALVTDPGLLLLDEPFAALDEITRFKLNDDLLSLWRQTGLTCLFVTHSVFEAVYLSSRVTVMTARPGRISADIPIDLPQPRQKLLRTDAAFAVLCRHVSEQLAAGMGEGV